MKPRREDGQKAIVIDVAYQSIDFEKIKNAGIKAVIFKMPCKLKWEKKNTIKKCSEAKAQGLLVGCCFGINCKQSINLQSSIISNIINKVPVDIYPIVEITQNNGITKKMLSEKCLKLLERVKESSGMDCIIKAEINFANENLDIRLRKNLFWVVDKGKDIPSNSTVWNDWTCFSYTDKFFISELNIGFEVCEMKEIIIINGGCDCGCGKEHGSELKPEKKCESMKGFIQGPIVEELQKQLNIQFQKNIKVDGCFTQETLDNCILIMRNARGPITKIVQTRLKDNGFSVGSAGIDGIYGANTIEAIKRFQKKYNLKVTGVVNRATWKELFLKR